jgi:excinuclease ABC subunit C
MGNYALQQNYEKAAFVRDIIDNITTVFGEYGRNFRFASIKTETGIDAIAALRRDLKIDRLPREIEAFDISNLGEDFAVAGMVKFTNGNPDKKNYRRFKIKSIKGINDCEMTREVISRRYKRVLEENGEMPDLILVDGGKGQLSSAIEALVGIGAPAVPVIGLAKKNEEIFLPGRKYPIVLEKGSPSLKLLQAVRDEVHRFSVAFNRKIRLMRIQESVLDDIPGIGGIRKRALLRAFSSINEIKNSTPEDICKKAPCIGVKTAERIHSKLNFDKKRY